VKKYLYQPEILDEFSDLNEINQVQYSQTLIYVLLYLHTFNLRTICFKRITLNTHSNLIYVLH
jgi:hypothetical protein